MDLSSIRSSSSNTASTSDATGSSALGKDQFLKLLMAQLGNQDPLNPADSQAFVAQLAQFSTVEQLQTANQSLESLLLAQASQAQLSTASLVGKEVVYSGSAVRLEGAPVGLAGNLGAPAASVTAKITDQDGNVVRTFSEGARPAGALSLQWDGRDNAGNTLPPGTYNVALTATDASGKAVAVTQTATGVVSGVAFNGGLAQLQVGGLSIPLSQVSEVHTAP